MHFLVTAGPTREYLDAVRFLSNPSSGRMGFACAREAAKRGHRVTLVTGPVELRNLPGVRTIRVGSAREMHRAVMRAFARTDAVIMAAAVSDHRPARARATKHKKTGRGMILRLAPNPDILQDLGRRKKGQLLIGFALEVQNPTANALAKARKKKLDYIVLNSPESFRENQMSAVVFRDGTRVKSFRKAGKAAVARWLVREGEKRTSSTIRR